MVVINAINEPVTFVTLTFAFISHCLTPTGKTNHKRGLS